jgi:hypothetical protein
MNGVEKVTGTTATITADHPTGRGGK